MKFQLESPTVKYISNSIYCDHVMAALPETVVDAEAKVNEDGTVTLEIKDWVGCSLEFFNIIEDIRARGFKVLKAIY